MAGVEVEEEGEGRGARRAVEGECVVNGDDASQLVIGLRARVWV